MNTTVAETGIAVVNFPSGKWAKFASLGRAKAAVLPDFHDQIYVSAEDIAARNDINKIRAVIEGLTKKLAPQFKSVKEAADALWKRILETADDRMADGLKKGKRAEAQRNPNAYIVLETREDVINAKKLPRQAKACMRILSRYKDKNFSEETARKLIEESATELQTKQDPWRIFQYYRARLMSEGLLKMGE